MFYLIFNPNTDIAMNMTMSHVLYGSNCCNLMLAFKKGTGFRELFPGIRLSNCLTDMDMLHFVLRLHRQQTCPHDSSDWCWICLVDLSTLCWPANSDLAFIPIQVCRWLQNHLHYQSHHKANTGRVLPCTV